VEGIVGKGRRLGLGSPAGEAKADMPAC